MTQIAAAVAGGQSYPPGCLYLVATPIGNLADISLRALHVLQLADVLACEDTRHTQTLLRALGLQRPSSQLLALHQHNEQAAAQTVVRHLQAGQLVAYVSDAGTPAISDPGARLVQAVQAAGLRVMPIPGPSSVLAALSASGADTTEAASGVAGANGGWLFAGFLPAKGRERQQMLESLRAERRAVVLLEAPHRIAALCNELAALGHRPITLARELTKQFENIVTLPAAELPAWLQAAPERSKGEFVLVLHPVAAAAAEAEGLGAHAERVLRLLLGELPTKTAVKLAVDITGAARNDLYAQALAWKEQADTSGGE
ncbi:MAG: 16S rRNA (cytidine(1402)-2'-O)-methyltransferase [Brachymonas sp.]|nr:16S rRNA (cytidine(1402)-2'-O)-methyltransferase [Brachymonas sp.]